MSGAATEAGEGASCCDARLKGGGRCQRPPAAGRRRCFQHGGACGVGAPKGNRNNWRDGFYMREAIAERKRINGFIRECLRTLRAFDRRIGESDQLPRLQEDGSVDVRSVPRSDIIVDCEHPTVCGSPFNYLHGARVSSTSRSVVLPRILW